MKLPPSTPPGDSKDFFVWETRSSRLLQVYFIPLWISICTSAGAHLWGYRNCLFPGTDVSGNAIFPFVPQHRLLYALKATRARDTHKKGFTDFFFFRIFFPPVKEGSRVRSELEWEPKAGLSCFPCFSLALTWTSYWTARHLSFLIYKHRKTWWTRSSGRS